MSKTIEVEPDAVRQELKYILSSTDFKSSKQLSQVLQFVVEETLAGRGDKIKAYTIATSVLGRKSSYDPQTDATVRILAGRLRSRLDHYYSGSGKNNPVRITIPRGCYVPVFECIPTDVDEGDGQISEAKTFLEFEKPSIAVLPLVNLNGHPDDDYFALGLTEQLILALSSYRGLRVLPRYATMSYKNQPEDVNRIGHALGARFVMEGSVRKVGQTMRVNVYLSDALMGRQVWAQSYERNLTVENLLAVQDEIAQNVTITIGDTYGGVIPRVMGQESLERAEIPSLTAYEALLHYIHFFSELSSRTYLDSRKAIERALDSEPNNPELLAMMSAIRRVGYGLGFSEEGNPLSEVLPQARRAVALDPLSQIARSNLVGAYQLARDPRGMIRESDALLSLKPYGTVLYAIAGWSIALAGEWKRGLTILREQMEALQYYPGWFHLAGFMDRYRRGEFEAALQEAHMMNSPTLFIDPLLRAAALGQLGRVDTGRQAIRELIGLNPDFPADQRRYLNWLIPSDELVDHLLGGLDKAGLSPS